MVINKKICYNLYQKQRIFMDHLQPTNLYTTEFQNIIVTPPPPNPVTTLAQNIIGLSLVPNPSQTPQPQPSPPPNQS